jgi:hypothetical protein
MTEFLTLFSTGGFQANRYNPAEKNEPDIGVFALMNLTGYLKNQPQPPYLQSR